MCGTKNVPVQVLHIVIPFPLHVTVTVKKCSVVDIVQQTWKTYKVTALYNFVYSVRAFRKYATQLGAYVQAVSTVHIINLHI